MVPTDEIMKYYTDRWYKDYELYFKYRYIEGSSDKCVVLSEQLVKTSSPNNIKHERI